MFPGFGEFCFCCCLPLLPGFVCSIHATWGLPLSPALYCPRAHPPPRRRCLGASIMTALPCRRRPSRISRPHSLLFKSHNMQRKFHFWCLHKPSRGCLEKFVQSVVVFALIFCDFWSKVSVFPSLFVRCVVGLNLIQHWLKS